MNVITLVNVAILAIMIFFIVSGYHQGFILKLLGIFSFFVIGCLSWYVSKPLSDMFLIYPQDSIVKLNVESVEHLLYNHMNRFTIFVGLFVILYVVILLIRPALKVLNHIPVISTINRLAGCVLGFIQALLILFLISVGLALPVWDMGQMIVSQSYLQYCKPLSKIAFIYIDIYDLNEALQSGKTFSKEEIQEYHDWLIEQNVSEERAVEILSKLRSE